MTHSSSFSRQFKPDGAGGYLLYVGAVGKPVTGAEFERLCGDFRRATSVWSSLLVTMGVVGVVLVATLVDADEVVTMTAASVVFGLYVAWVGWVSYAPYRLVGKRPAATPELSRAEARKLARSTFPFWAVVLMSLASGPMFVALLFNFDGSLDWWLWTIGTGAALALSLWVGYGKLRDRWG